MEISHFVHLFLLKTHVNNTQINNVTIGSITRNG